MKAHHVAAALAIIVAIAGCAGSHAVKPKASATSASDAAKPVALVAPAPASYTRPCTSVPTTPAQAFDCDRRSILAMSGEFRIRFAFDETAALQPGYAPPAPQRSGATEWVKVIADTGTSISLQHILVLGDEHHVVKHWRQDWQYQPTSILRYEGKGRFTRVPIDAATATGLWSQTVYEVDDAPRYGGLGRWTHDDGIDAWESDLTLRPLPRRDYSKRSDYQALQIVNRHTLTPAGWVHEQFNTKLQLDDAGRRTAIAREQGLNQYIRIDDYDFSAGQDYWAKTAAFWARTRALWQRGFDAGTTFTIGPDPNGEPRVMELFELARRTIDGEAVGDEAILAILRRHGLPLP